MERRNYPYYKNHALPGYERWPDGERSPFLVDLKDAGDPVKNVAYYQRESADKLAMLDIATVENRKKRNFNGLKMPLR
jgi:hypothetical protein